MDRTDNMHTRSLVISSLLVCLSMSCAGSAVAQIYKSTDAQGNPVFSNQPPTDGKAAQTVDLPPVNSIQPVKPAAENTYQTNTAANAGKPYSLLELTGLPNDEALRANNGSFGLGVNIKPDLRPGHKYRLVIDGEPYGQMLGAPPLPVAELDRGSHTIAVDVINSDGQTIQESAPVSIDLQRVHWGNDKNNPSLVNPNNPDNTNNPTTPKNPNIPPLPVNPNKPKPGAK